MPASTLTTARLTLTPATPADHPTLLAHWTTPAVREFLFDGKTLTPEEISHTITTSQHTFTTAGHGLWLITTDTFIGTAGLRPLDDLGQEIYYSLTPESWRRGYASEAAHAVIDYAFETLRLPAVFGEVDEANTASAVLLERLGLTRFATVPGELGPLLRFRRYASVDGGNTPVR
ncbi:GNAT family N-acetyltransferase [Nocardia sp. NPDC056100]|uniref:GNAT family N-acetyltransferase n=1 Tax=Nocardia sp. NPDC056100 TaxID=3345712 RepID=UPI0035E11CD9